MVRWPLKPEARVVGVDDGPYERGSDRTLIVLTLYRLDGRIEGVCPGFVGTDGTDSAERIARMLADSGFLEQARCIVSDGACLAGFNVLDMDGLYSLTGVPVMTCSDSEPDGTSIMKALKKKFPDWERRLLLIDSHPPVPVKLRDGICYVRSKGVPEKHIIGLVNKMTLQGRTPEPIRLSHIIAGAMHKALMEASDG